jgi:hypothetical protein
MRRNASHHFPLNFRAGEIFKKLRVSIECGGRNIICGRCQFCEKRRCCGITGNPRRFLELDPQHVTKLRRISCVGHFRDFDQKLSSFGIVVPRVTKRTRKPGRPPRRRTRSAKAGSKGCSDPSAESKHRRGRTGNYPKGLRKTTVSRAMRGLVASSCRAHRGRFKQRPDIGASVPAGPTNEQGLQIR